MGGGRCFVAASGRSRADRAGAALLRTTGPEWLARGPAAARETQCRGPERQPPPPSPNAGGPPRPLWAVQSTARPLARLPGTGEQRRQRRRLRARCLPPALHSPDAPARRRGSAPSRARPAARQSVLPGPRPGRLTARPAPGRLAAANGASAAVWDFSEGSGGVRQGAGAGRQQSALRRPSSPLSQAPACRRTEPGALSSRRLPPRPPSLSSPVGRPGQRRPAVAREPNGRATLPYRAGHPAPRERVTTGLARRKGSHVCRPALFPRLLHAQGLALPCPGSELHQTTTPAEARGTDR